MLIARFDIIYVSSICYLLLYCVSSPTGVSYTVARHFHMHSKVWHPPALTSGCPPVCFLPKACDFWFLSKQHHKTLRSITFNIFVWKKIQMYYGNPLSFNSESCVGCAEKIERLRPPLVGFLGNSKGSPSPSQFQDEFRRPEVRAGE